jgi:outer membrane receptor for ferrienterochelin and colicin
MKKYLFLTSFLLIILHSAQAQEVTVSGFIKDKQSGEALVGATIIEKASGKGTVSNRYGFYSLKVAADTIPFTIRMIGYKPFHLSCTLSQDTTLNFELEPSAYELADIEIRSSVYSKEKSLISLSKIQAEDIRKMPMLLGEADGLKTLQLLPGVSSGQEGSSGLNIRGGSPDQNLILVDGVPVYNVFHLFGFMSVFNTDAIKGMELIKGGIPARYGGRLSSVLDIQLKEGNQKRQSGALTISPVASSLTLEGPIIKDKASYLISGRRTWLDLLAWAFQPADFGKTLFNFHDLSGKINYKASEKSQFFLSMYNSRDKFTNYLNTDGTKSEFTFNWGNFTSIARWNYQPNPELFLHTSLSYSQYQFNHRLEAESYDQNQLRLTKSILKEPSLQFHADYRLNPDHTLRAGAEAAFLKFQPEVVQLFNVNNLDTTLNNEAAQEAVRAAVYAEDMWEPYRGFFVQLGLRGTIYKTGNKNYLSAEPRLAVGMDVGKNSCSGLRITV